MEIPETRYAKTVDGVHIAYRVVGAGPIDLVWAPGTVSHVELYWEEPALVRFIGRLASFSRLMIFDKRGTGMSDHATEAATLGGADGRHPRRHGRLRLGACRALRGL